MLDLPNSSDKNKEVGNHGREDPQSLFSQITTKDFQEFLKQSAKHQNERAAAPDLKALLKVFDLSSVVEKPPDVISKPGPIARPEKLAHKEGSEVQSTKLAFDIVKFQFVKPIDLA